MKRLFLVGLFAACASVGASEKKQTVQVEIDGLNCALCSAEMKNTLKQVSNADVVVPRLECGKLFLDISEGKVLNARALKETLLNSGFTMGAVTPISLSAEKAGKAKC